LTAMPPHSLSFSFAFTDLLNFAEITLAFSRAELKMAMFLSRRVLCTASWRVWLKKLILLFGVMLSDPHPVGSA
jgi:hypothetical protein